MSITPSYDGTGTVLLRTADVRANIDEEIVASPSFGPSAQLSSDKALSQILDPVADQLGQAYDVVQEEIDSRDPDAAEGVHLDNLGALVGVVRQPATYSHVTLTLTGTPATVVIAGKRSRVPGTTINWALSADATIPGGGSVDAAAVCDVIGPQDAGVTTITEIVDAVAGWTGVTNAAAATPGQDIETDAAYRRRRSESLSRGGTARAAAIRAVVEALDFVEAAAVAENTTMAVDANGLQPKSYMIVVWPTGLSTAQEELIIAAIWSVTPAGIYVDGSERYTVTDSQGFAQELGFEYGSGREIWAVLNLTVTTSYPATGDALVEAALKVFDDDWTLGSKVLPDEIVTYLREQVPGIDHCDLRIKFGSAPTSTDTIPLYPEFDEVPYFDAHVTVNS